MNNVSLIGRLTKDVELKTIDSGSKVCSFCIAVDAGKDKAYFIDCVAWDKKAEHISTYFHKGDRIGISGILTTRQWKDSEGGSRKTTEVLVMNSDFCSNKSERAEQAPAPEPEAPSAKDLPEIDINVGLPFEV